MQENPSPTSPYAGPTRQCPQRRAGGFQPLSGGKDGEQELPWPLGKKKKDK